MAEGKAANEDGDTGEDGIEEIEGPHRADADEVEQCPFDAQVGERLVQALEDPVCAGFLVCFVCISFSFKAWRITGSRAGDKEPLHAPEPTQDIHRENGNARSGGNASQRLFRAGFPVREAVAADHDCDQTCNLRNRAGEEALDRGKAGVER